MKKTLIVVAVIVAVFLGYAVFQKSKNTAQSTEIISDKTEWKTHIHSAGDYSFEYPGNWLIFDNDSNDLSITNYDPNNFLNNPHFSDDRIFGIEIHTFENPNNLDLVDWLKEYKSKIDFIAQAQAEAKEIKINDLKAMQEGYSVNFAPTRTTYIQGNAKIYSIGATPSKNQDFAVFYDRLLESIKILK